MMKLLHRVCNLMNNVRVMSFIAILAMMGVVIAATIIYYPAEAKRVHQHLQSKEFEKAVCNHGKDRFCTHLPLVIIDVNGQQIRSGDDQNAYTSVGVQIIDNDSAYNHATDSAAIQSKALIKYRGASSLVLDKKQYLIKFISEDGKDNKLPVLGMSADEEWVLNGSYRDKTLFRNYFAYNIAGEIMGYAPNVRFCEVILRDGVVDTYQGVYTIIESIKQDKERVNIAKYDQRQEATSFIVRRDRYSEAEVMLNNYGTAQGLTANFVGIKYPAKSKITDKSITYIENYISQFEKILYSPDAKQRQEYTQFIDVDSFVDYFIINEFFANYDAGQHSTYAYKDIGGKLHMGPVWDFDTALDNYSGEALAVDFVVLNERAWFDALVKDKNFVDKVIKRYAHLRKGVLSEEYLFHYIDDMVAYLGEAVGRNNSVWGSVYRSNGLVDGIDKDGNIVNRNTATYDAEIERIKKVIHAHGAWLDENIDYLYGFSDQNNNPRRDWLAVLFIAIFFIIIILVQRK